MLYEETQRKESVLVLRYPEEEEIPQLLSNVIDRLPIFVKLERSRILKDSMNGTGLARHRLDQHPYGILKVKTGNARKTEAYRWSFDWGKREG